MRMIIRMIKAKAIIILECNLAFNMLYERKGKNVKGDCALELRT
jgi:hypothetical protein